MTTQQLEQFFRKKAKRSGSPDSTRIRRQWIHSVTTLYDEIEFKFLARLIKDKVATIRRRSKTLSEEALGEYNIDDLVIKVGDERSPSSRRKAG